MSKLSAVIITHNEERNIGRCIDSLQGIADEIVVLDSFSQDRTAQICREKGTVFQQREWEGYAKAKNYANRLAKHEYILSMDADEALSEELASNILKEKEEGLNGVYCFNRMTNYCGKWIKHSGWYPDKKKRIFPKSKAQWADRYVHEEIIYEEDLPEHFISGDLYHYSYYSLAEHKSRIQLYAELGAKQVFFEYRNINLIRALLGAVSRFVTMYFFRLGFLDGGSGFRIASISSYVNYLKYRKFKKIVKEHKKCQRPTHPKVLHVSMALSWRGGEQQLTYLYGELEKLGIQQVICCAKDSPIETYCQKKNIPYVSLRKKAILIPHLARKLHRINRTVDLIHTHDSHSHSLAVITATLYGDKKPVIVSRRVDFPIKKSWFSHYKYDHPSIKKIICVSEAIKRISATHIKDQSLLVTIYSGIDASKFKAPSGSAKMKQAYGIAPSTLIIGNVAAIAPHKDYYTFVDTAVLLKEKGVNAHFLIIGDGPLKEDIKNYVKEKNADAFVTFTGFREDLHDILHELDLFLITSETEGLGTSILDAFAAKVPVVATAAGGIPEIVSHKKTGWLGNVKDPDSLAEGVIAVTSDQALREQIVQNASEKLKLFTYSATAEKTLQVYREVLH